MWVFSLDFRQVCLSDGLKCIDMKASRHTTFRIAPDDLEEISRRARARGLTRSRYFISCALGKDPLSSPGLETLAERVEALDGRVLVLERQMGGVSEGLRELIGFELEGSV